MDLRERIIEESTKLFIRNGIKSIRMDDIASHLGVSKRTIYELFIDKEALIMACMIRKHDMQHEDFRKLTANLSNVIEEFMALLTTWDEDADVNYRMMMDIKKFYPKVYNAFTADKQCEGMEIFKTKLQDGINDGLLLPAIDIDMAVGLFTNSIYGLTTRYDNELPGNISYTESVKYIFTYFIRGIASEKGIRIIDEHLSRNQK